MSEVADHISQDDNHKPLDIDERCWQVRESVHPSKDPQKPGQRWMQRVWVVRGDMLAEFQKDLGPSWAYPLARPFMFVSMNEYSVGESLEQANCLREMQPEYEEPSDLMQDWYKQLEELKQLKDRRSVVGPHARIQRN